MTTDEGQSGGTKGFKTKELRRKGESAWAAYRRLQYGQSGLLYILWAEFLAVFVGPLPGALGLAVRKALYPTLFKKCGKGCLFGRNPVLRHAEKIELGDGVTLDDDVTLDAKGEGNEGIRVGSGCYIGKRTIVYCKGGDIELGAKVNVSSNCQLYSGRRLEVGEGTVVAAYCYLLSGGHYRTEAGAEPFCEQGGNEGAAVTSVGPDNWLGAGTVVVNGARTGRHVVAAAGSVVRGTVEDGVLVAGAPASVKKKL